MHLFVNLLNQGSFALLHVRAGTVHSIFKTFPCICYDSLCDVSGLSWH